MKMCALMPAIAFNPCWWQVLTGMMLQGYAAGIFKLIKTQID
jgi:hypothetical protein